MGSYVSQQTYQTCILQSPAQLWWWVSIHIATSRRFCGHCGCLLFRTLPSCSPAGQRSCAWTTGRKDFPMTKQHACCAVVCIGSRFELHRKPEGRYQATHEHATQRSCERCCSPQGDPTTMGQSPSSFSSHTAELHAISFKPDHKHGLWPHPVLGLPLGGIFKGK